MARILIFGVLALAPAMAHADCDVDCGNGYCCAAGNECVAGGCMPAGWQDCGGGNACPPGYNVFCPSQNRCYETYGDEPGKCSMSEQVVCSRPAN